MAVSGPLDAESRAGEVDDQLADLGSGAAERPLVHVRADELPLDGLDGGARGPCAADRLP